MRNGNSKVEALVVWQNSKGNGSIERWSQRKTSKILRKDTTWYLTRNSFQWSAMTDMRRRVKPEVEVAAHLIATRIGAQRRQGKNGEVAAHLIATRIGAQRRQGKNGEAGNDGAMTRGAAGDEIGVGTTDETISTKSIAIRETGRVLVNVTIIEG